MTYWTQLAKQKLRYTIRPLFHKKSENENRWALVLPLNIEFPSSLNLPSALLFNRYAPLVWFLTWRCALALGAISPALLWVTHPCKLNDLARNQSEQLLLVLSTVTRAILQSISKMKRVRWHWPFITPWSKAPGLLSWNYLGNCCRADPSSCYPKLYPSSVWCFIKTWQSH